MSLALHVAPALYALFLWWFFTGAVLWLDRRRRSTHGRTMAWATLLLALAVFAFAASARDASPLGAVTAFTAALLIWGWCELSFLLGYVTGPRRSVCPPGATGWRRFRLATQTLIWHEVALVGALGAMALVALGQPNQFGLWTFATLWVMRLSAKLNVFLGVRNLSEDFLPDHLRYLATYFRRRPMNALWPVSVAAGAAAAGLVTLAALSPGATAFEAVGGALLGALIGLAVLEHVMMVTPTPETRLWRWAMPASATPRRTQARRG